MGVHSLSSFVAKIDDLKKEYHLKNTKVVIDGNNLMHSMYSVFNKENPDDYLFASNFLLLRRFFVKFFDNMAKCKVTPILVFDGSLNPDLEESRIRRLNVAFERSKCLSDNPPDLCHSLNIEKENNVIFPFLVRKCFLSVAKEANVTCLQTRLDSDLATARLANELKCPLISDDSDFLIMTIDEGVISCESLNWQSIQTSKNKSYFECKIYKIKDFVDHFGLKPEMLPIFASLVGNDGIDGHIFDGLVADINTHRTDEGSATDMRNGCSNDRFDRMNLLLHWLSEKFFSATHAQNFIINYLENNGQKADQFLTSVKSYESAEGTFLKTLLDYKLSETTEDQIPIDKMIAERRVPKWFLMEFFQCKLNAVLFGFVDKQLFLMRPLVEDFKLESCFECSYELNAYLLAILRLSYEDRKPIEMKARSGSEIKTILVHPKTSINLIGGGDQKIPIFTELHNYSDKEKKTLLFSILSEDEKWIDHLEEKLRLLKIDDKDIEFWTYFLVIFKYWKRNTKLYLRDQYFTFVRSLVLSLIYYRHRSLIRNDFNGLLSVAKNRFKPHVTHYLNEFQFLYSTIDNLVALLGYPIKAVELHFYFNGILYYNLFEEISANRLPFYAFREQRLNSLNTFIMSSL